MTISTVLDEKRVFTFFSEHLSRKSASEFRSALQNGDFGAFWRLWRQRVRNRAGRLRLETLRKRLDWGLPAQNAQSPLADPALTFSPNTPFEATRAFYADLLDAALHIDSVSGSIFVEQLQNVLTLMNDALALDVNAPERQLVLGEMALLLGLLYPEISPFSRCADRARRAVNDSIRTNFDAVGFPPVERLGEFRPLMASYTRTLTLAERVDWPLLSVGAQKRLEWAALALCRLTGFDGRMAFEPSASKMSAKNARTLLDFYTELFRFDRDATDRAAVAAMVARISALAGEKGESEQWRSETGDSESVAAPWIVSRDSTLAVLRGSWEPDASSLVVAVDSDRTESASSPHRVGGRTDRRIRTECRVGGRTVFSGVWDLAVRLDGKTLEAAGDWENVCEESSAERLYWELSLSLAHGFRVERQFLLAPNERIALLADSVIGPEGGRLGDNRCGGRLEYKSRLTLNGAFDFFADGQGREALGCFGGQRRPFVRVFPLTLSEWKQDSSRGEFFVENDAAILTAVENGVENVPAIYAAYCFDLDRKRLSRPFTWRRLTVGRNREKASDTEAVGFRYQAGNGHYLFYKSLADPVPRSVLGEHFDQEFVFARFIPDGKTEPILEVEWEDDTDSA